MDSRNETTVQSSSLRSNGEVGSQATGNGQEGWFKKQKPSPKRRVMPKKGWRNCRDKQT
ncbi:hypothetical protein [Coleofasciculus sp. G2-EDA-02]|uniref:hypothetical protein n=1 Tax=Coleofasciculus sp. G2-EDA-02 TaxID=3069529 RepID=UPI003301544C